MVLDKPQRVKLPEPREDSGVSIECCIRRRRSVRSFHDQALKIGDLGQLLWAAQGITGSDGRRSAPSAGALYPLELSVAACNIRSVNQGVYRYLAGSHEIVLIAPGFQREKLVEATFGQEWMVTAGAIVCIAAVFERTTVKYRARGRGYAYLEAGHAAENLMLQAVALGLAATMVGAFSDDAAARILRLGVDETPLCLIGVGPP
jgi:SagB-type dehydrogenase family enzyme